MQKHSGKQWCRELPENESSGGLTKTISVRNERRVVVRAGGSLITPPAVQLMVKVLSRLGGGLGH